MNSVVGFLRDLNRRKWTYEQLEPYFGKCVLWNDDYTAIVDSDADYGALLDRAPPPPEHGFGQTIQYIPDPRTDEAYQPPRPITAEEAEELARVLSLPPPPAAGNRVAAPPP